MEAATAASWLDGINNNKLLWGATMLLLNTGSRTALADLPAAYEWILVNVPMAKYAVVASMFFVATHDALASVCLTILYVLVVDGILHQNRRGCLVPKSMDDARIDRAERRYRLGVWALNGAPR